MNFSILVQTKTLTVVLRGKMLKTKQDYITESLRKVRHKKWELFVISRILHGLDDDEIEFVTQQLVRRGNGSRALTDVFFPQFNLHIEVDEPFHNHQVAADENRQQDIVSITNHDFWRIPLSDDSGKHLDLPEIRSKIDKLVAHLKKLKNDSVQCGRFEPWDWAERYSATRAIRRGYVSVDENSTFRLQIEALKCFGFKGKGYQRGVWKINDKSDDVVWFPRLYPHYIWNNEFDGEHIYERVANGLTAKQEQDAISSLKKQRDEGKNHKDRKTIVFAKVKDPLGQNLLRYVGTFKMNTDDSAERCVQFDRISTVEPVRPPNLCSKIDSRCRT